MTDRVNGTKGGEIQIANRKEIQDFIINKRQMFLPEGHDSILLFAEGSPTLFKNDYKDTDMLFNFHLATNKLKFYHTFIYNFICIHCIRPFRKLPQCLSKNIKQVL